MASRVARNPIVLPKGVEVKIQAQEISVKGGKGHIHLDLHPAVAVTMEDNVFNLKRVMKAKHPMPWPVPCVL
jgi:large subunit ribosomal protein L6